MKQADLVVGAGSGALVAAVLFLALGPSFANAEAPPAAARNS